MPRLIVSVRDAEEALIALEGGASLIDVKEPARGPLGRADDNVIESILEAIGGRAPVSAALGELADGGPLLPCFPRLSFVKWGLSRARRGWDWFLRGVRSQAGACEVVPCAYADWQRAQSPAPEEACRFVCEHRFSALLIDTWGKDGTSLWDWLAPEQLAEIRTRCTAAGVRLAVAGSLKLENLGAMDADWVAVRGAVCEGGRSGRLALDRVRRAARALTPACSP